MLLLVFLFWLALLLASVVLLASLLLLAFMLLLGFPTVVVGDPTLPYVPFCCRRPYIHIVPAITGYAILYFIGVPCYSWCTLCCWCFCCCGWPCCLAVQTVAGRPCYCYCVPSLARVLSVAGIPAVSGGPAVTAYRWSERRIRETIGLSNAN